MKVKGAFIKDTFREIKNSFGRFLSIFAIIALGCGFFSGIKVTMSDMQDSAADYFVENNLMDLKLVSTYGVKSDEISAIKKIDNVEGVMAAYSKDVFCENNGENDIIKVMSFNDGFSKDDTDYMNHPVVVEGRLPKRAGECVVDDKFKSDKNYAIGKKITLLTPDENEDLKDTLVSQTYEIVGIVTSPLHIGYERDKTNVGTGNVSGFILVLETDFVNDFYSEIFVSFKNLDEKPFSDEYLDKLNEKKTEVINAFNSSVDDRYNKILSDSNAQIDLAKGSIATLEDFINSDLEQLQQLKQGAEDKIVELNNKISKANDNNKVLLNTELAQTKSKLEQVDTMIYAKTTNDVEIINGFATQLIEAKEQLSEAELALEEINPPQTYESNRYSSDDYGSFIGDSEKVDSIAKVFPVFFILVAALVCLTTMTRMIEEQRIQIGTYKALGYSPMKIMSKYLVYALVASVLGSLIGTALGLYILPKVIYSCYKILYNIPEINTPFKINYALACMAVSVICTGGAVAFSCYKELLSQPAQLMRPRAPKKGKRVILEKVKIIWNRLDFLAKVTVRNLLRYKKRFFMTIIGVAGCTALILTGLGLKYSITSIIDLEFKNVFVYDGIVAMNVENFSSDEAYSIVTNNNNIVKSLETYQTSAEASANDENQAIS
ncbi:MAG: ABC transporter permease, partial [Clostridiales bacterium]|nr:ABC transporter permease [Clostridiales bacterium]